MAPIFHDLAERINRRGIIIILSDLFDDVPDILAGLKHLRHKRHEVVVLHVLDAAELDVPVPGGDAVPRPGAVCPSC